MGHVPPSDFSCPLAWGTKTQVQPPGCSITSSCCPANHTNKREARGQEPSVDCVQCVRCVCMCVAQMASTGHPGAPWEKGKPLESAEALGDVVLTNLLQLEHWHKATPSRVWWTPCQVCFGCPATTRALVRAHNVLHGRGKGPCWGLVELKGFYAVKRPNNSVQMKLKYIINPKWVYKLWVTHYWHRPTYF